MKKIIVLLLALLSFTPFIIHAEENTNEVIIQDETLKDACEEFELTCNHNQKDVNPSVPNIYVFVGDECTYCNELLVFLSDIYDTYNNRANFVIFNVSKDEANYALYKAVTRKYNDEGKSVPFIAIDKKFYSGFEEKDRQGIILSIENAYEANVRYDVVGDIMNGNYEPIETKNNSIVVYIVIASLIVILLASMLVYLKKNK